MKMKFSDLSIWIFSICVFTAVFICIICNMVMMNTVEWFVYPVCSLFFTWLILMPVLYYKKKGVKISLGIITALILPFLLLIDQFQNGYEWFLPLGFPIAAAGIIFMWMIYGMLIKMWNLWIVIPAIIFMSGILCLVIDLLIKNAFACGGFPWGYLVAGITTLIALIVSILGFLLKKGYFKQNNT